MNIRSESPGQKPNRRTQTLVSAAPTKPRAPRAKKVPAPAAANPGNAARQEAVISAVVKELVSGRRVAVKRSTKDALYGKGLPPGIIGTIADDDAQRCYLTEAAKPMSTHRVVFFAGRGVVVIAIVDILLA